ncbi:MAG TPA: hypothetical protein VNA20_00485 [Frankiaceae bacterium]|nr:hypothetical protein [Frankiaceae bacterium]
MFVAHPLIGSPPLAAPPLVLAAAVVLLAAFVATRVAAAPARRVRPVREPRWLWVPRLVALLVLLLLLAVARGGPPEEPRNLAAIGVVHLLWPGLLLASAAAGPLLWRALDPWRALGAVERLAGAPPPGRAVTAPSGDAALPDAALPDAAQPDPAPAADAPPDVPAPAAADSALDRSRPVWPAVVTGGAWAAFLALHAVTVSPRKLATALAVYTIVLLAGSLALGRDRWLPTADGVGLVVGWTGLVRRGRLLTWHPPPAAAALLGAVFGGVAFTRLRLSSAWGEVALRDDPETWHRVGAVAAVALGAAVGWLAERWATRRGAAGSVAAALVPVTAATVVALTLRRLTVAAQLVPGLASDPFDKGWRLLGPLGDPRPIDVNPWGTAVQQALSVGVVALGAVAAAWVVARRVRGVRARDPGALLVYVTSFLAVLLAMSR